MLLWDQRVKSAAPAIAALDQAGRFRLAAACIDDIRDLWEQALRAEAAEEGRAFVASALGLLAGAVRASDLPVNEARALIDTATWIGDAPPGVWDMAMAFVYLLRRAGGALSVDDVLESMSAAYQVVLQVAVLLNLHSDVIEDELIRLEEANPACVTCIAKQLRHISE